MPIDTEIQEIVREAANQGAELVLDALNLGDRDRDLINLVINATVYLATEPTASFDEMVDANFSDSSAEVRAWWDW